MASSFFDAIKREVQKALSLIEKGKSRPAINILNRCMRRLEKFIDKAEGPERLQAISLMKIIGQLQTNISEKQIEAIKEDSIEEEELLALKKKGVDSL